MFRPLRLGRAMGIDLFVHPTFWLLPLLYLLGGLAGGDGSRQIGLDLAVLFAAFGCVALHELGHAAAAKLYGIRTRDIILYPIGGVARLEGMPERAWPEIVIALAGPLVNVFIAAGIYGMLIADGLAEGSSFATASTIDEFWFRLMLVNVSLVVFNLIPAFPMDGGRVFRAVVSLITDRVTATEVASVVGGVFAALMALVGLFGVPGLIAPNFMLVILAGAVFMMGRAELANVRQREEAKRWERQRAARGRYYDDLDPDDGIPVARPAAPADGWQWDPHRGGWVYWQNGYPVRRT